MTGPVLCVMLAWIGWVTSLAFLDRELEAGFDRKGIRPVTAVLPRA